jgi:hypothetical protein
VSVSVTEGLVLSLEHPRIAPRKALRTDSTARIAAPKANGPAQCGLFSRHFAAVNFFCDEISRLRGDCFSVAGDGWRKRTGGGCGCKWVVSSECSGGRREAEAAAAAATEMG